MNYMFIRIAWSIVRHIFRECNVVVDLLAKRGAGGSNMEWSGEHSLPSSLRGLLHLDRIDLPYLRIS